MSETLRLGGACFVEGTESDYKCFLGSNRD